MRKLTVIVILTTMLTAATQAQSPELCEATNLTVGTWNYHGLVWDSYNQGYYYSASKNFSFDCTSGNPNSFTDCWVCGKWLTTSAVPPAWGTYTGPVSYSSTDWGQCGYTGYGAASIYISPGIGVLASGYNYTFECYLQPYDYSDCGNACSSACSNWVIAGSDSYSL